jgi:hypothetical protein
MAAYSPNDHRLMDHMPQQRLQEALRLGLLARKRVAVERVLAERSVVREGLDGHAATTMVNEIDNVDHDLAAPERLVSLISRRPTKENPPASLGRLSGSYVYVPSCTW